jgi:phosphoglycolate phosphatase-like HAD superfamily hydrolase
MWLVALLLLFDVDGTLILTGGAGVRAMTRAFADVFGVPDGFEGIPMPGRTDRVILADALARHRLPADGGALDRFHARYLSCLSDEILPDRPRKGVLPGVRGLLDRLAGREDVVLALLTGNYLEAARIKLTHFGLWSYFICGAFADDSAIRHELVPIAVARAAQAVSRRFLRSETIVVGDTPNDVACARAAGVRSIAVATGPFSASELRAAGGETVLDDLADVDRFLGALIDGG